MGVCDREKKPKQQCGSATVRRYNNNIGTRPVIKPRYSRDLGAGARFGGGGTGERDDRRRTPESSRPANCTRTHKLAFLSSRRMRRRRRRRRQTSARPLAACAPRRSVAANARRTCPSNARWSPHRNNHAREIPRRVRENNIFINIIVFVIIIIIIITTIINDNNNNNHIIILYR